MAVAAREEYKTALQEQRLEVQEMVLAGLKQVQEGKVKDFNEVCDRLEKKYKNAAVHNYNDRSGRTGFRKCRRLYCI